MQSTVVVGAFWNRAFARLEPCALKGARTVLRRGRDGNATPLSDLGKPLIKSVKMMISGFD